MSRSLTIEEDNISVAWAKAFIRVVDMGRDCSSDSRDTGVLGWRAEGSCADTPAP